MKDQRVQKKHLIALIILLCAVPIAAYFGRPLERKYPFLIYLIPYAAFMAVLFHGTRSAQLLTRKAVKSRFDLLLAFSLVSAPFLIAYSSGFFIDLPIERIHVVKYGSLAVVIGKMTAKRFPRQHLILAFLLTALVGTAEETSQLWIPDRRFDPRDLWLNVFSALCGVYYCSLSEQAKKRREEGGGDAAVKDLK